MGNKANLLLLGVTSLVAIVSMAISAYLVILPTFLLTIEMTEIYFWVILFSFHFVLLLTLSSFFSKSGESRNALVKLSYAGIFIFVLLLVFVIFTTGLKGLLGYWGALSLINFLFSLFMVWFYNLEQIRNQFITV